MRPQHVVATISVCDLHDPHRPHLRYSMVWPDSIDRRPRPLWCLGQYDQNRQNHRVVIAITGEREEVVGEGATVVGSALREPREPGACGSCREPEDFDHDADGALVCHAHREAAPDWAHEVEVGLRAWRNDVRAAPARP